MAEGGFDPDDFEMTILPSGVDPLDDDPSEDLLTIDITQNDPGFSVGSQQETSFITPEASQASWWIELYRASFKSKYGIDDNIFNTLRLDLERRGGNLYYEDVQINRKDGKGFYALASIKGKGAAEFKRIVQEGQRRVQARRSKQQTVQGQPIEPSVVDRQSMTFDNPMFDDEDDAKLTQRLTDLRTIKADLEDAAYIYTLSRIPRVELREMEGLTNNLRKTKSNMEAAYKALRKEEGDIGVIKEEIERETARDDPDQNKIKHLEEEIRQREESYFANQRRYKYLNVDVKNQVERIRAILTSEKPLRERLRELFKKEGITILSITTAIGMIISTIALAITNLMSSTKPVAPIPKPSPSPSPSPRRSFIDRLKGGLRKIASYLKSLAGKAAAIPGVVGSVISWLFKSASQIVEVLANNVILLVIAFIGLLFAVLTKQVRSGTRSVAVTRS